MLFFFIFKGCFGVFLIFKVQTAQQTKPKDLQSAAPLGACPNPGVLCIALPASPVSISPL